MNNKIKFLIVFLFLIIFASSLTSVTSTDLNDSTIDENTNSLQNNIKKDTNSPKTITLTNKNFNEYVTNGEFNDEVSDGDTIDVDGMLDSDKFSLTVNKSLNFISSKNNSYISLYTQSTGDYGEATGGQFTFTNGASGSNITNLYFYNTRVVFNNVSNVNVNNISVIDYEKNIGSGTGHFIIGGQSNNVTITNSYFYTKDNGQHSTAVFSGCSNILFENNTIIGEGRIGNLLYLNTFNVESDNITHSNFIIRNNIINASLAPAQVTCFALCLTGSNILIDNNTIDYIGYNICPIYGGQGVLENITIQNNNLKTVLLGNGGIIGVKYINNTKIINNQISSLRISKSTESTHHSEIYNNTIGTLILEADNCLVEENNITRVNNSGNNNVINNNIIRNMESYTITTTGENTTITNNKLASNNYYGDESINGTATTLENNTNTTRIININDNNWETYLTQSSSTYTFNNIINNSIVNMDTSLIIDQLKLNNNMNVTFNSISTSNLNYITVASSNLTFNNIYLPDVFFRGGIKNNIIMNNTTFLSVVSTPAKFYNITQINSQQINDTTNTYILAYSLTSGTPKMANEVLYSNIFDQNNNKILSTIPSNSNIVIRNTADANYNNNIIIDKPVNIISYADAIWKGNITFISGSEGSNITGLTINSTLNIQANNINVFNNTIKKIVMDNCINCNIYNNTINTTETTIELKGVYNSNITNNTIETTDSHTITIDSDSAGNIVKDNILIANETYNIYSVDANTDDNIIQDNSPLCNTTITIDVTDSTIINTEIPINISITSEEGTVNQGNIIILVNGVEQANETVTNGKIESTITPTQKGTNTIKAWYFPSNIYNINSQTTEVEVSAISTTLKITNITTAKVGENITITSTIKDQNNDNVNEGSVTYIINNDTYVSEVNNGISTINITTKEEYKSTKINAYYTGEQSLDNSSYETTLNLNPGEAILTINQEDNDDTTTLNILVTDINGNKVKSGYIRFTGDITDLKELENGTLTYTISKSTKDMTINATFRLNQAFETKTETITIIAPKITNTKLENIIGIISNPTTITATITDEESNPINNGSVTFTDDEGNIIAEVEVTDGIAATTITFTEEINTNITATYNPIKGFTTSNATASLEIQKPITNINVEETTFTAGETTTLTATVTDQLGNNITGGKIVFKINGKTLKDSNGKVIYAKVTDGIASIEYTIPDSYANKNLTLQVVYSGTNKYDSARYQDDISITKQQPSINTEDITSTQTSTITLKANITDGSKVINTGKVVFKINGKTVKDSNGKVIYAKVVNNTVSVEYTLPSSYKAKTYTITATLISTEYDRIEDSKTLTITKA